MQEYSAVKNVCGKVIANVNRKLNLQLLKNPNVIQLELMSEDCKKQDVNMILGLCSKNAVYKNKNKNEDQGLIVYKNMDQGSLAEC